MTRAIILTFSLCLALSSTARAESAADVIDRIIAADSANYAGIDNIFQRTKVMMGPQIDMIRNMASGGGIEVVSDIVELRCDNPPTAEEIATKIY